VEHYGATELPAGALTNWTDRPGYCGFIPPEHQDARDVVVVDETGRELPPDAPGEVLLRVSSGAYRGYLDPAFDEARLWRGLREPGDCWWRSGDLLRRSADGFFTFVDRMGDTYRWRGENVSSADVEDALRATGLVDEAVVYGVRIPKEEGKVGMASIMPKGGVPLVDLEPLRVHLERALPPYAIPIFVRQVSGRHEATATLKILKCVLAEDPFSRLDECPHAVLDGGRYVPLDSATIAAILSGHATLRPGLGVLRSRGELDPPDSKA
jgi:fatty-acyl-CoA synthase